jgi:tRNA U34 5-methylaminomethyl-2-thiouridine-forming methyltransferase MnmC
MPDQPAPETDNFATIDWEAGDTPRSVQFDDPYFARENGRAETRHVFLAGNGLPERWQQRDTFTIAELGFGTGLNFLETLATFTRAPGECRHLTYASYERYPISSEDLRRAIKPWPDLSQYLDQLLIHWPPASTDTHLRVPFENATLTLFLGDAAMHLLPSDDSQGAGITETPSKNNFVADAWYLDGFSPAKNADLWGLDLMQAVYRKTAAGGTFSTYTAAGWVRRNLLAAGFEVHKVPGYGRKRERLAGCRA